MKQTLPHLKIDEKVWATIEETQANNELLVNFHGDLVRVTNASGRKFRPGQRIQLKVTSLDPLGFQLLETRKATQPYRRRLDLNI
jgi:hypothetical protein